MVLDLAVATCFGAVTAFALQGSLIFGRARPIRQLQVGPHHGTHLTTELVLDRPDGTRLQGWVSRPIGTQSRRVVIYFGGRNENTAWVAEMSSHVRDTTFYAFNYRGFGKSTGLPSESRAKIDAQSIYFHVLHLERERVRTPITFVGRALGCAVALWLARDTFPESVVLLSPFESVRSVLALNWPGRMAGALLRQDFDSRALAARMTARTLVLLAQDDALVPHSQSLALCRHMPHKPQVCVVPGVDHKTLPRAVHAQRAIADFLRH